MVADTQSKGWQNLASDHLLVLASKLEVSEVALAVAVVVVVEASVEDLEVIEEVSVVIEVASTIEVALAVEEASAIKVEVALEAEGVFQTVLHHQMRPADQVARAAVDMVVGTQAPMALDPSIATAEVAMDMVLVVNESTAAARVGQTGLTAAEINVVALPGAIENQWQPENDLMVPNRSVIETGKETASAIDMAAAAAAAAAAVDETRTTAPEKDTTKATDMTTREAKEGTDANHPLLLLEAHWFVGGYRILKFLATSPPPFLAEGKKGIAASSRWPAHTGHSRNGFCENTTAWVLVLQLNHRSYYREISEHAVFEPPRPQLNSGASASIPDAPTSVSAGSLRERVASRLSNVEQFLLSFRPAASGKFVF